MTPDTPTSSAPSPRERASELPHGVLLFLAIFDLGWAAVGLLLTVVVLPLLALVPLAWGLDEPTTRGVATAWTRLATWERVRVVAMVFELLAAPVLNVFLLVGALRLLRTRPGALRCVRIWAVGVLVLSAIDLVWVAAVWVDPWSWIAVALVIATPAWALTNLLVLGRASVRAQIAPVASGANA